MRTWNGSKVTECNLCHRPIGNVFIDGLVKGIGSWAIMCHACHKSHGAGIGIGLGQRFNNVHGIWIDARDCIVGMTADELKRLLALKSDYARIPPNGGFADPVED